jgi:GNAT superfamily N-acetyltransferase
MEVNKVEPRFSHSMESTFNPDDNIIYVPILLNADTTLLPGNEYSIHAKDMNKGGINVVGNIDYDKNGYISFLFVDKEYRGKGIGSELIRRTIENVQKIGITSEITLHSFVQSYAFYKKLGFDINNEDDRRAINNHICQLAKQKKESKGTVPMIKKL